MQHQGVQHFTTLRYDLEAGRHPRGSVDETTSETPRAMRTVDKRLSTSFLPRTSSRVPSSSVCGYSNLLLGRPNGLMMCEGGRRVIARGHDADVVGQIVHIVPPDGKLLSSLARHRDRHVVILLLHHVISGFKHVVRGRMKDHRVERTHHVRVRRISPC
jgi:hypothetical protein